MCGSSSISGTIDSKLFGFGEETLFVGDIETAECRLDIHQEGHFHFDVPLGACGMSSGQISTGTGSYLIFETWIASRKPVSEMV